MSKQEVSINKGYELYQIITDFGDPLEIFREGLQNSIDEGAKKIYCRVYEDQKISGKKLIIDIWDDGNGLPIKNANNFFDLANSTKIDEHKIPKKGKYGYKGHGAKIFFNSEKIEIFSKTKDISWKAILDNPIKQIETEDTFKFDVNEIASSESLLPQDWPSGFWVRITGHLHFKTAHTKFKLNHKVLRDYIKWFTVFGSIKPLFENINCNCSLFLHGLEISFFKNEVEKNNLSLDPQPSFIEEKGILYEKVSFGHYIPSERMSESAMKTYAKSIESNRPYYDFYSKTIFKEIVSCNNNISFNLLLHAEGYETKRRYDPLLSHRGKTRTQLLHLDSDRYGLWACKGGIPVEKIDHWIEGAKGTFTYLQGFVDCELFSLTANRGSIHNTDIEILDIIQNKVNETFNTKKISDALNERNEIEKLETQLSSIEEDGANLKTRFAQTKKCKNITLPDGTILKEPKKNKSGGFSEAETLILLIQIISKYPDLFDFKLLDYDTSKGIDCIVEFQGGPKYIELKGTLNKKVDHPYRHIYKFICYDINVEENETIEDIEEFNATLRKNKSDIFSSFNDNFKGKKYTSYKLDPSSATVTSMEIICLKTLLQEILNAKIN